MKNNKKKCLIVDDEPLGRQVIAGHLEQFPDIEIVAMCGSAMEAATYLSTNEIDLIFLDIEMPIMKGTDFYRNLTNKPHVIFTTAYREYAIDGFDLEAIDYLLKPVTFPRLFKALERYNNIAKDETTRTAQRNYIFVRENRREVKLFLNDILYINSLKDYIRIHTPDKTLTVKESLTAFSKKLPDEFLRVHRCYTVNETHITAITRNTVEINGTEIPLGEKYRTPVSDRLYS